MDLGNLVRQYLKSEEYHDFLEQMDYYRSLASLDKVIDYACFGIYKINGLTHFCDDYKHVFEDVRPMYSVRSVLMDNKKAFTGLNDFHELYLEIRNLIRNMKGIGDLMLYDITYRIGAHLGYKPDRVYARRRARIGLAGLYELPVKELDDPVIVPYSQLLDGFPELSGLSEAGHAENFLCIYHRQLKSKK